MTHNNVVGTASIAHQEPLSGQAASPAEIRGLEEARW